MSEPDVEFTPLFNDRMMSAIFPHHPPFAQKRSLALKDLTASPLILMAGIAACARLSIALAAIGHLDPPAYKASYISTALGMVEAGLGVTILPASVLRLDSGHGLMSRPIQNPGSIARSG